MGGAIVAARGRAPSTDAVGRRLAAGVLVSVLFHGFLLALQFGVPGFGLPGKASAPMPQPIRITLADVAKPVAPVESEVPPPVAAPRASEGMRLLDRVVPPVPAPPKTAPRIKRDKPRRSRRISPPLPALDTAPPLPRVIAQSERLNDFVVPLPRPEEAIEKTLDRTQAQEGVDEGTDATTAALEAQAEAAKAPELAEAARLAEQAALQQEQQLQQQQEQRRAALAAREAEQRQLAEEQKLAVEQRQAEEQRRVDEEKLAVQQRLLDAQRRAEQQKLATQQRLAEEQKLADEKKRTEELAATQRAQQRTAAAPAPAASGQAPVGAGPGAGGSGSKPVPGNMLGSDLANRAREMARGLDLLGGTPPVPRVRDDDERGQRRAVVGAAERDVPLRMYVDSWGQKIERNGNLNYSSMATRVRIDPLVSVAIRSDGSVDEVTIVRSSGRAEIDEAVRRIVRINARYAVFPPNIAARYDVIEIRRVWTFDEVLKLLEEVR